MEMRLTFGSGKPTIFPKLSRRKYGDFHDFSCPHHLWCHGIYSMSTHITFHFLKVFFVKYHRFKFVKMDKTWFYDFKCHWIIRQKLGYISRHLKKIMIVFVLNFLSLIGTWQYKSDFIFSRSKYQEPRKYKYKRNKQIQFWLFARWLKFRTKYQYISVLVDLWFNTSQFYTKLKYKLNSVQVPICFRFALTDSEWT